MADYLRISIIGPSPPLRGGISQHTAGLAEALVEDGHRVDVIGYRRQYPKMLFPGRSQIVESEDGPTSSAWGTIDVLSRRSWAEASARAVEFEPDLVVAEYWHPIAAPALSFILRTLPAAQQVVICHNARPHEPFPCATGLLSTLLEKSTSVLCHSQHVAGEVSGLVPATPVRVVSMPLLPRPRPQDVDRTFASIPSANGSRVSFLGHIRRYKGVDVLLEAWPSVVAARDLQLTVAGECYFGRRRLSGRAEKAARTHPVLFIDRYLSDAEILAWAAASDLLVMPYLTASQSGLPEIARALDVPVLASGVGGLVESAANCPSFRLTRSRDPERLAADISRELERSPRDGALRRAGLARYERLRRASWIPVVNALG